MGSVTKSLDEICADFIAANAAGQVAKFAKSGIYHARPAIAGEVIKTVIDGKPETVNTATAGSFVVVGPKGEQYILDGATFAARYIAVDGAPTSRDGYKQYHAIGSVYAYKNDAGPFTFMAPWKEEMICNPGDMIATTEIGSKDIYRIEREVFASTYAPEAA